MDEFNKRIENSLNVVVSKEDLKKSYLKSLDELYPNIHSYKNKDALEHYRLLSLREPSIPNLTDYEKTGLWMEQTSMPKHPNYIPALRNQDYEGWEEAFYKPELSCLLTRKDKQIAGLIKSHCKGVMICLSPKTDYYPTIQSFMDRVAKINCKQIETAKYYFEINTKNGKRMHCHMYAKMKKGSKRNSLRSYFKSRFPYMIITDDPEKSSALKFKPDITYGWEEYLTGLASDEKKQELKSLDYQWREDNNIPHILNL